MPQRHDVEIKAVSPLDVSITVDGEKVQARAISLYMEAGKYPTLTIELPAVVRFRGRADVDYEVPEMDVRTFEARGGGDAESTRVYEAPEGDTPDEGEVEIDKAEGDSVTVESTPEAESRSRHPAGRRLDPLHG